MCFRYRRGILHRRILCSARRQNGSAVGHASIMHAPAHRRNAAPARLSVTAEPVISKPLSIVPLFARYCNSLGDFRRFYRFRRLLPSLQGLSYCFCHFTAVFLPYLRINRRLFLPRRPKAFPLPCPADRSRSRPRFRPPAGIRPPVPCRGSAARRTSRHRCNERRRRDFSL